MAPLEFYFEKMMRKLDLLRSIGFVTKPNFFAVPLIMFELTFDLCPSDLPPWKKLRRQRRIFGISNPEESPDTVIFL